MNLQTLVYQYFEFETIERFEDLSLVQLRQYLRRCCEAILSALDAYRHQMNFLKDSPLSNNENSVKHHDGFPIYLSEAIKNEAKKFVFDIVNMSKDENPYSNNSNSNFYPRQVLLKDNRFLRTLQGLKKDFDGGSKNFL